MILIAEYLHKNKLIHRDIKPENFMIDHKGFMKMIDVGCAKICDSRSYTVIGTPYCTKIFLNRYGA